MNFDLGYMIEIIPELLKYLPMTLYLAITSMIIAVIIGVILALILVNRTPGILQIAKVYISFFRGTPALVQLLLIYFGLPQLFPAMNEMSAATAAIIAFSLNTSAYLAEIFRAGLQSVDKGQAEAAVSVGMTYAQAMRGIVIPQAVRNAIPATGNIFIGLIKNSSLAFTIGVTELLAQGKLMATANLRFFEAYLAVGLIYWALTILYNWLQQWYEYRIGKPYRV
ncbi:putative amino-acid transport system permease protein [Bhargavaea ginsengi]|uniref:Putative amino-acid transport system permease protein n=1 Tax=Bhargavaea ginsengi TaxID=426757 RepID=A0A1H6YPD2_9BACL|nr:amino acid ABC transporter permease [Bhargavaea ginsengi]SEJ43173.1 putative amino-acid transport system permease protein [Bhargavaea ginsengi]